MPDRLFKKREILEVQGVFNLKQIFILAHEHKDTRFVIPVPESRFRNILAAYRAYKALGRVEKWMLKYRKAVITKFSNNNVVELVRDDELPEKDWVELIMSADWYKTPMRNFRPLCV